MKLTYAQLADIVRQVDEVAPNRSTVCGYDLLMGLEKGNVDDRARQWLTYILECKTGSGHVDEMRDGAWVPAIPLKMSSMTESIKNTIKRIF